ncbi:MAG: SDR family oxidoreductase [Alphaproteobacteria bacterium]
MSERKAIFITGAASGMGLATARLFASKGWFVGGFDVNDAGLDELQKELGQENCLTGRLDVRDIEAFHQSVARFAEASGGRMDVMFNNAGIGESGRFHEVPHENAMNVVEVNLKGVINGCYAAIPVLKETPGSLMFNNASSSATYGMPGIAVYSATKHGVKGLTEALSVEWAEFGVRVADSLPGLINTPILSGTPNHSGDDVKHEDIVTRAPKKGMFALTEPVEVAKAVYASYEDKKGRLHWYIPKGIGWLDRLKALKPEFVRAQLMKRAGSEGGLFGE